MKILFLDQFSELGGAQQSLLDTVEAVRRHGWQASAMIPDRGALVEKLESRGVPCDEICCGPYGAGGKSVSDCVRFVLDLPRQVRAVSALVQERGIDLIYVNGPRLLPAVALASRGRAPVVFHAHSDVYGVAGRLLHRAIRRSAATVIACSNSVLDPLRQCVDADRTHVIPNGVHDAGYRERRFGSGGNWRIGILGRIAPDKGQLEFARAAAMVTRDFPRCRFVICGASLLGALSEYFEAVRTQTRALDVEFLGWQSNVSRVLDDLDLLVVPSKREGMGRVIVEAFSAGVPVVAFPAGGIPEVVLDSETGFLTREFTADALAARIRDVLEAPEAARRVAANARQEWARLYTVSSYQRSIIRVLEGLLRHRVLPQSERQTQVPLTRR